MWKLTVSWKLEMFLFLCVSWWMCNLPCFALSLLQATLLAAFVCFTVGSRAEHITAAVLEAFITSLLLLLYLLKLNKRLTFLFWPLVVGGDIINNLLDTLHDPVLKSTSRLLLRTSSILHSQHFT